MNFLEKISDLVKNQSKEYIKFLMIPSAFCGTSFSIMTIFTVFTNFEIRIEIFQIAHNHYFIVGIGILSYLYILKFYPDHLNSKNKVGWVKKIHKPFTMILGLFAAFTVYSLPQLGLWFHTVASQTNFDLSIVRAPVGPFEIPVVYALAVIVFAFTSITKEMFLSCDDKPRLFLSTQGSHSEKFIKRIFSWIKSKMNK